MLFRLRVTAVAAIALAMGSHNTFAQRANEVAITSATDAFGTKVGSENTGLYTQTNARGFNPQQAGNVRLFGLYFDQQAFFGPRLVRSTTMRVGLSAQSFPFPAPTGIVDFGLYLPGNETVMSAGLQLQTPVGLNSVSADIKTPLVKDKIGLVAGAIALKPTFEHQAHSQVTTGTVLLRFTPNDSFEFIPYIYRQVSSDEEVGPFINTAGAFLPPKYDRSTFFGQGWADKKSIDLNTGAFMRQRFSSGGGDWLLQAGLFRSLVTRPQNYAIFYRSTQPDGTGTLDIQKYPEHISGSYSGEIRATGIFTQAKSLHHTAHFSVRGRFTERLFGGGNTKAFGLAKIGEYFPLTEPTFVLGIRDKDKVRQISPGVSYIGQWSGIGELSVGLQKAYYDRDYGKENVTAVRTQSRPLLYNGTIAAFATKDLSFYAGHTRGLEEFGTAPDNAANGGEPMRASVTKQVDGGLRYQFNPNMSMVAGLFEVKKPYFDRTAANVFANVGALRHRGFELSFTGKIAEGLNVVAGAMFLQARVSGSTVDQSTLGRVPSSTAPSLLNLNVQYGPASWDGFAIDAQVNGSGGSYANRLNTLRVSSSNTLALGARYPFTVGDVEASVRVQVNNITNAYTWTVDGSSGRFAPSNARNALMRLAADF